MRVAIFSTKPYDRQFLEAANPESHHDLVFLEPRLTYAPWKRKACKGGFIQTLDNPRKILKQTRPYGNYTTWHSLGSSLSTFIEFPFNFRFVYSFYV